MRRRYVRRVGLVQRLVTTSRKWMVSSFLLHCFSRPFDTHLHDGVDEDDMHPTTPRNQSLDRRLCARVPSTPRHPARPISSRPLDVVHHLTSRRSHSRTLIHRVEFREEGGGSCSCGVEVL